MVPYIIAAILMLFLIVALFVRKHRGKQTKVDEKKLHDRVAKSSTELLAASSVNDLEEIRKKLAILIGHQSHWLSCSDCSAEFNQQLIKDCDQRIKVDTLNNLWAASQLQRSSVKINTLQKILDTADKQNAWFDTINGGRKGIVAYLLDEMRQWIASISKLSPDTVESVKNGIQGYIAAAQKHGARLEFPDNWNTMVARDISTPKLKYFINVPELDFRQFVHALRRAVHEHDTTTLAMLAAVAVESQDSIDEQLIRYLLVECTQEQPPIDAIDLVKLLGGKSHAQPVNR